MALTALLLAPPTALAAADAPAPKPNILASEGSGEQPPPTPAAPKLQVGDPAPSLQGSEFIRGEPVQQFEQGKAYLIDFWATWCGPCIDSIPHLESLHERYKAKGLVVIGQNVWEDDIGKVKPFLEKMGDRMTFRVATDPQKKSAKAWLKAAGKDGIPTSFLVGKDGKIAWIDHPEVLNETVVEQVLAGTFDVANEKRLHQSRGKMIKPYYEAFGKYQTALKTKNWAEAQGALERMKSIVPAEDTGIMTTVKILDFQLLVATDAADEAIKLGEAVLASEEENTSLASSLAETVGRADNPSVALLNFAESCAKRANTATRGREPGKLENLAKIYFRQGNRDEAIRCQQQAIDRATSEHEQKRLRDALAAMKNSNLDTDATSR